MTQITITEALSEVNLVKKKIETKRLFIHSLKTRATHIPDPYEKEGGTPAFILKELQSLGDLQKRLEQIRSLIAKANVENFLTIHDVKKTVYEWLVWKREIAQEEINFQDQLVKSVQMEMQTLEKNPSYFKDDKGNNQFMQILVNVNIPELNRQREIGRDHLQKLDGLLSLFNATKTIDV